MDNIVTTPGSFKSDAERQAFLAAIPAAAPTAPTLDAVKRAHCALLSAQCQEAIYAGFVSSALGAPHTYPAKDRDQNNLAASVLRSMLPGLPPGWTTPFWCMDVHGVWDIVQHTPQQIQQVGEEGAAAIAYNITRNKSLAKQVWDVPDGPDAVAQVKGVVW